MFQRCTLILIDVQEGFHDPFWGKRNNPQAEKNIRTLLDIFREKDLPVIHVQHVSQEVNSPLRPGLKGLEFMQKTSPIMGEMVFQKVVNSAFINTKLEEYLHSKKIEHLILVGFTSDHCVSTTARMASNLGFKVSIISDATVAFERQGEVEKYPAQLVHDINLSSLKGEFAEIFSTAQFISMIKSMAI